jgi:undecaprenyl-phosphate 4-deoxy-4-formamido-L-arabinose transferase
MKISVVIPVFNGAETLLELYTRVKLTLEDLFDFEVLFIHDGGSDESWYEIIRLKSQNSSSIKAIKLSKNFGQHNAIKCGIENSAGELIVTLDEDLQHAPEDILKLLQGKSQNESDLVYGSYKRRKHSKVRNISSKCLNRLLRVAITGLHKDYSSFRLMDSMIARQTLDLKSSYPFLDGDLARITNKITSVPVSHYERAKGASSYTVKKLIWHSLSIIAGYQKKLVNFLKTLSLVLIGISTTAFLFMLLKFQHFTGQVNLLIEIIAVFSLLIGSLFLGLWIIGIGIEKFNMRQYGNIKYEIIEKL